MHCLRLFKTTKRLLSVTALLSFIFVAGCDEYVRIIRDHDVRIPNSATWAWRPAVQETANAGDSRPVTSRDQVVRNQPERREST
ncbi:MAG: hypothetical protein WA299_20990, partial [Candidatus Acidiferrum sp.]